MTAVTIRNDRNAKGAQQKGIPVPEGHTEKLGYSDIQ
jgi:hypothetical protein